MSMTTEIAQDQSDAVRDEAKKTVTAVADRAQALYADAVAWARPQLRRTQDVAKDLSAQTVSLVKANPIKTAAIGAALGAAVAAAGVAIGLFAARARA